MLNKLLVMGSGLKAWVWRVTLFMFMVFIIQVITKIRRVKKTKLLVHLKKEKQLACRYILNDETIFVSVPSYRDPELVSTIFDCLEKATCPLRIFIGVCQQNTAVEQDGFEGYKKLAEKEGTGVYTDNIRMYRMEAGQAQGPMYARSLIEQHLYNGEKYYLLIDSHTTFVKDWDSKLIHMLVQASNKSHKPVITMYPEDYQTRNAKVTGKSSKPRPPSFFRLKRFNEKTGLPEVEGPVCKHRPREPLPNLFWGACCSFSLANMMHEVPYDPYCPYVFLGEEIAMAARLFTHGYDLFTPTEMVLHHMWVRRRPTFWENFSGKNDIHKYRQHLEQVGYRRLRHLLGLQSLLPGDLELGKYGLGNKRSLEQYERYCGVNFLLQTATNAAWRGLTSTASQDEIMLKLGSAE